MIEDEERAVPGAVKQRLPGAAMPPFMRTSTDTSQSAQVSTNIWLRKWRNGAASEAQFVDSRTLR
jgi:hypothetical protein